MSETADPRIGREVFDVLLHLSNRSARWIENLGFFLITRETGVDPAVAYIALGCSMEVD